ncbi:MAG: DUF1553 domain-containing protein, partial [Acidobacteriota bacterium]|nr:DUF1553 domain-containing protein [Acidobacteriota bacterium]
VVSRFSIFGFKSGYPNYLRVEELKAAVGRIDAAAHKRIVDKVRARFSADVLAAYDVAPEKRTADQKRVAVTLEKALTDSGLKENAKGLVADLSYTDAEHKERERLIYELGQASLKANAVLQTATVLGHADVVPAVYMTSRGDWRSKGEKVGPAFPAILSGGQKIEEPENAPVLLQRRKALALWLTQPDHPLTARVIVNRLWQGHFGRGIVGTPNDFGRQGEPPTHPELLDWLASELVSQGWSLKKLHKEMMLSDAYQRSSQFSDANARVDADNRFLWRMNRQRMDAETLRDSVLAASGKLNLKMGGKPVIPSLSKEEYSVLWARNQWPESLDPEEQNRRSVYLYVKRQFPLPMLSTFDQPDTSVSCGRRDNTTVAPQALTMMNGDFMVQQARYFAERLKKRLGGNTVRNAWQIALGRAPSEAEAARASQANLEQLCLILLNTNEFLYID